MKNYDNRDDEGDNNGNEDVNNNGNTYLESGFEGPVFDPITTPWSCGKISGTNSGGCYTCGHYISNILNMCHKLMCAKFGVLDWCRCHTEK